MNGDVSHAPEYYVVTLMHVLVLLLIWPLNMLHFCVIYFSNIDIAANVIFIEAMAKQTTLY
jgi:hypothetical protein